MIFREEIVRSPNQQFARAVEERSRKGQPIISLGKGEPDLELPVSIKESIIEILKTSKQGYSDTLGIPSLREKLSLKLKNENSINCSPDNIIVTAGSKQAFYLICMTILEPGDEIIIINPSYVSYIPQVYFAEPASKVICIDIDKSDFHLQVQEIERQISSRTKLLVINSPNNPAGYVLDLIQVRQLFDLAEKNGFYIISDEVYEKLIFSDKKHFSIGSFEHEPIRIITINGFSKSYAMSGWGLGYACFPKKLRSKLQKLQLHINTNTCTLIQQAMDNAFNAEKNYHDNYNKKLCSRAEKIKKIISKTKNVHLVPPEAGFFAFLNISGTGVDSNTFCSKLVEETGVAITPGLAFGNSWDDHVRISFAISEEILETGMSLMSQFINSLNI